MNRLKLILILLMAGCLEPFEPQVPEGNARFLVIDGVITDQPGPYQVRISTSSNLNSENQPVSGINDMVIESMSGEAESLIEVDTGTYETTTIRGSVGESYRLVFSHQGRFYQSAWATIPSSGDIEQITFREEERETEDRNNTLLGLQFFVDSGGRPEDGRFYRFEWEETWRFNSPAIILFRYLGNDDIDQVEGPPMDMCWRTVSSRGINLTTTDNLTENVLSKHP